MESRTQPAAAPAANIPAQAAWTDLWNNPQLRAILRQVLISILEQILAALKAA